MKPYTEILDALRRESGLADDCAEGGVIRCHACAHECRLSPGGRGICLVRSNVDGRLMVPWGYTSSVAVDPIEKKPFYHLQPGARALSFGMLGCNFRCPFCQNWSISQTLRDDDAVASPQRCTPEALIAAAERAGATIVSSTYNEPLITSEWALAVFQPARERGMMTTMVSNGFAGERGLDDLDPWLDAMNVDLKCFTEAGYRQLGGRLEPVKRTIRSLWERGKWVEVITLVVPTFNDSAEELRALAAFLLDVSPDIPWHVSAYRPQYKMTDGPPATPRHTLDMALRIGRDMGLHYVYAGNMPGLSGGADTLCPGCGRVLVSRSGFGARRCALTAAGSCPHCDRRVAGRWASGSPFQAGRGADPSGRGEIDTGGN